MYRYSKNLKKYHTEAIVDRCALCNPGSQLILEESTHYYVIQNKYPYDIWEHRNVIEHLMVVPKEHKKGLAELSTEAKLAIIDAISTFEAKGYDIYARSVQSALRSVVEHQHTHLIKTDGKPANISLYIKKPYVVTKI